MAGTNPRAPTHPRGLCDRCAHVVMVTSGRGSTFVMCGRSKTDARFVKYPPLPVLACAGFEPRATGDSPDSPHSPGYPRSAR